MQNNADTFGSSKLAEAIGSFRGAMLDDTISESDEEQEGGTPSEIVEKDTKHVTMMRQGIKVGKGVAKSHMQC